MKFKFLSRVVGVKRSLENVSKPERDIESSMLETAMQVIMEDVFH